MNILEDLIQYLENNAGNMIMGLVSALAIILVGYVTAKIISNLLTRVLNKSTDDNRGVTLAPIIRTLSFVALFGVAVVMSLDQLGINISALIAGAGVLGLAVGFGAQELVKDCVSGFFLILDDVLAQGDIVEVDAVSGTVERVGLRVTAIRSFNGQLWYVPNGTISKVGNWNRSWVRVVVEVGLAYEQDVAKGLRALQEVGDRWAKDNASLVLEPPEAQGVMTFNGSDVGVRLVIKISNEENDLWRAEREIRTEIKSSFDAQDIDIPFSRQVVYHRVEEGEGLSGVFQRNESSVSKAG